MRFPEIIRVQRDMLLSNQEGRILLTDYHETEELQTEAASNEEEIRDEEEKQDDRSLLVRWTAWVNAIDR